MGNPAKTHLKGRSPPDAVPASVLKAADLLHKWFAGGKLSRWGAR